MHLSFPGCTSMRDAYRVPRAPPMSLFLITRLIFGEEYRSFSCSLRSLLHSPVTLSLLGPDIFLNTLFFKTFSLCNSLHVRDQVSHPYKTAAKIILLCILICIFLDRKLQNKIVGLMLVGILRLRSALNFFTNAILIS